MPDHADRSFAEVLENIVDNIQRIIRSEVRLAKVEIQEEAGKAGRAAAILLAGGIFCLYALGFLLLSGVYGLEKVVEPWLAALMVTVVTGIIAATLVVTGRKRMRSVRPRPERAIQTVKENLEWAKNQTR
ncbi:MAG TPA: phage holin family protein [Bryobacteraceae bacterium]|nr:phage holin family protein [Bryobacteraceae bacterium]